LSRDFFTRNYRDKAVAVGLSMLLWTALVYRSQTIHRSFEVPAAFNLLPARLTVVGCDPPEVLVTLAGERKDFSFLKPGDVRLAFDLLEAKPGRTRLPITVRDLSFPKGLELEEIEPRQVQIEIRERPPTNSLAPPSR